MKTLPLLLTLVSLSIPLHAQPPPGGRPDRLPPPPPGRERGQPMIERWLNHLERTRPEEHARLVRLREENPAAFREEVRDQLARLREQNPPPPGARQRPGRFAAEVEAVRAAATPEERAEAMQTLRAAVRELVEQRMEMREERIQAIQADLARLREQHETDLGRKDELIQETLDQLLTPPPPPERE